MSPMSPFEIGISSLITGLGGGVITVGCIIGFLYFFRDIAVNYLKARTVKPFENELAQKLEGHKTDLQAKIIEPIKHEFAKQLEAEKEELAKQLADHQASLQVKIGKTLRTFDDTIVRRKRNEDIFEEIKRLEYPVLLEANRVIRRVAEVMREEYVHMYRREWDVKNLSISDLDGNKQATAVFRLMRFFGAYGLYAQRSSGLLTHSARDRLRWYFEIKIDPVFASGPMLGDFLMLRDTMIELSESMLDKSTKWDMVSPIGFVEWIKLCKADDSVVNFVSSRLAKLFSTPNARLALIGIYLIDLRQDLYARLEYEDLRNEFLLWLRDHTEPEKLSIWGKTETGETDLAVMDPPHKVPRNYRSPHYDQIANPMRYRFRRSPLFTTTQATAEAL